MKFVDGRKTGKSHGKRTQFKIASVDMLYWNFIVIEAIIDPLYYVILIYYRIHVISHYNPQLVRVFPQNSYIGYSNGTTPIKHPIDFIQA